MTGTIRNTVDGKDLVVRYTQTLSSLVENTSYSEVLEQMRQDLGR